MSSAALMPSKSFPVFNGCVSHEKREKKKKKKEAVMSLQTAMHCVMTGESQNAPAHTGMRVRDKCISAALQSAEIQRCYVTRS